MCIQICIPSCIHTYIHLFIYLREKVFLRRWLDNLCLYRIQTKHDDTVLWILTHVLLFIFRSKVSRSLTLQVLVQRPSSPRTTPGAETKIPPRNFRRRRPPLLTTRSVPSACLLVSLSWVLCTFGKTFP